MGSMGNAELLLIGIVIVLIGFPFWLTRRVCTQKGFNRFWGWLTIIGVGPLMLIIFGILRAKPDYESELSKTWSKYAIVTGLVLIILEIVLIIVK